MNKTFYFGKVAYFSKRRVNSVEVSVSLSLNKSEKFCFSVYGRVWNASHTDTVLGGQILDTLIRIPGLRDNKILKEIYELAKEYHLNDTMVYCNHQNDLSKELRVKECPECGFISGNSWYYKEIPDKVLYRIMQILR